MPNQTPKAFQAWIDSFIAYLHNERGMSEHTQSNYQRQLSIIAEQLVSFGVEGWQQVDIAWVRQL